MRVAVWMACALGACGGPEPGTLVVPPPVVARPAAPRCPSSLPAAACDAGVRACAAGDAAPSGAWRYALISGPFEPTQDITAAQLAAAWRAGTIAAAPETEAILAPRLGPRTRPPPLAAHPALDAVHWAIVPAHELAPSWSVITIDGHHPLTGDGPLVLPLCGATPVHNIDPAHLTTLV
ncbi:MAG: hypothetical protein ABIY55_02370, partial [Kofleriaceae bacterium]